MSIMTAGVEFVFIDGRKPLGGGLVVGIAAFVHVHAINVEAQQGMRRKVRTNIDHQPRQSVHFPDPFRAGSLCESLGEALLLRLRVGYAHHGRAVHDLFAYMNLASDFR